MDDQAGGIQLQPSGTNGNGEDGGITTNLYKEQSLLESRPSSGVKGRPSAHGSGALSRLQR